MHLCGLRYVHVSFLFLTVAKSRIAVDTGLIIASESFGALEKLNFIMATRGDCLVRELYIISLIIGD